MSYYLGIDIGTGSTKALAVNSATDKIVFVAQAHYPILQPMPHYSEQDPEMIWDAFVKCVKQVVEQLKEFPKAIGLSSAMHSLIPVDTSGKPLTNMITWADARSTPFAEDVYKKNEAEGIYKNTGTPIHAMSPLCKIGWMRNNLTEVFSSAHKFISIKEFIWYRLFNVYEIDHSIASATGLFDITRLTWYPPSLEIAGITTQKLSVPVSTSFCRHELRQDAARKIGLPAATTFVIGGSDGCLANLGSNAMTSGTASLTIGTSGAVRMVSREPRYNFKSMTFNYILDEKHFVCGGPINNGGVVWKWFVDTFVDKGSLQDTYEEVMRHAEKIEAGAEGLIFLPYLMGERAPIWNSKACGVFFGINITHTEYHFARAVIEGICLAMYSVALALEQASGGIECIYASGGFTNSREWLQIMANVFNKKIYLRNTEDASALGAALMAVKASNNLADYPMFKQNDPTEVIQPHGPQHEKYKAILPVFMRLYEKLKDEMTL